MKQTRSKPKRGNKVFLITSYCTNAAADFESFHQSIYIIDSKRRMVWQEESMDFAAINRGVYNFSTKQRERSLPALLRKYDQDYQKLKHFLNNFELEVVELGSL